MREAWTRWLTRALLLVMFALMPAVAAAQTGKIQGTVTDAQSGQALDGVQVVLLGTGIGVLTDENGRYFMLNVPPETYTVIVRRIGFQTQGRSNVQVVIDVTRTVNFELAPAQQVLEEIQVTAAATPLVQPGVSASGTAIGSEEIEALPVVNIQGVLQLQQGFLQVPQNTDIVSFTDTRRNPTSQVRVRGGRNSETLTLIDLVPVNNFVFGGSAFDITNEAIEQVNFQRGGFEPQYGNALSGIINIATRTGGTSLAGALSYQTSAVGGFLGSRQDELLDFNQLEGFVSGPVPGTGDRLRFLLAGRSASSADRVLEFDDDVYDFSDPPTQPNSPHQLDLWPGWRAFGYDSERDLFSKVSLQVAPRAWLHASYARYQRQRLPFDFDFMLVGFDPLTAPAVDNLVDSLAVGGATTTPSLSNARAQDVVEGSIRVNREYFALRWDQTVGRWVFKGAFGRFDQDRLTCSVFSGVCLGNRFEDPNFTEQWIFTGPGGGQVPYRHPAAGTDIIYGGENLRTTMLRGDVQSQITDHHNIQFGAFYQRHDLSYREWFCDCVNEVRVVPSFYFAKPWDAALYFQDRIEYDFLTIKLGARYDYGRAGGLFFANPRDPTNGTRARNVCDGDVFVGAPFTWTDPATNQTYSGFEACAAERSVLGPDAVLLDSAAAIAQQDDFTEASRRTQFSPRIGVSFPLTGNSAVFFNFGRYAQVPLYNNVFTGTGVGTVSGAEGGGICTYELTKPQTRDPVAQTGECTPIISGDAQPPFIGNPNLLVEQTTSYEVGYATEFLRDYSFQIVLFNKDQYGLTGIRNGGVDSLGQQVFDEGSTYGASLLTYNVLVNQDYQTVRGFEIQMRRRIANNWGFNLNYQFSQATTNAAPPDREEQNLDANDPTSIQEIRSEIDQAHVFNATLQFRVGIEPPRMPLGWLFKNTNLAMTFRALSGLPYTPTLSFQGFTQIERNSGTAPGAWYVNLRASKEWAVGALRYGAFVNISNLFDTKYCTQVFASTGRCDAGTVDQNRRLNGNAVGAGASSTYFDRPGYYGARRQINAGMRVSF